MLNRLQARAGICFILCNLPKRIYRAHFLKENEKNIISAVGDVADGTASAVTPDDNASKTAGDGEAGEEQVLRPENAADTRKDVENEDEEADEESEEGKRKSFMQILQDYVNTDEDIPLHFSVQAVFGGDSLLGIVARNIMLIFVIVFFSCVNISLRYMMDNARMENDKLNKQLVDRQYKALSVQSRLKEMTLSTHIEQSLRDTTIHIPTEQAFPLKVPK